MILTGFRFFPFEIRNPKNNKTWSIAVTLIGNRSEGLIGGGYLLYVTHMLRRSKLILRSDLKLQNDPLRVEIH